MTLRKADAIFVLSGRSYVYALNHLKANDDQERLIVTVRLTEMWAFCVLAAFFIRSGLN